MIKEPDLSKEEIERIFQTFIIPAIVGDISPQENPEAFILGGQPGSGKSALVSHILKQKKDTVFINGDDLRSFHPKYVFYLKTDEENAADNTQPVTNIWVEALIQYCMEQKMNIIVEGTMRTTEAPRKTGQLLKDAGYKVSMIVLSVPHELSLLSLRFRYQHAKNAGYQARYTKETSHDEAYQKIEGTLKNLMASGLFERYFLYFRENDSFRGVEFKIGEEKEVLQNFKDGRSRLVDEKERELFKDSSVENKKPPFNIPNR